MERHRAQGHICHGSDAGPWRRDPRFPVKYRLDPWCWDREVGFHRSSAPAHGRFLMLGKDAREVSERRISARQAIRLGAGAGTSPDATLEPLLGLTLSRVADAADFRFYRGDPHRWAEFGAAAAGKQWVDGDVEARKRLSAAVAGELVRFVPSAVATACEDEAPFNILERYARVAGRPMSHEMDQLLSALAGELVAL